MNESDREMAHGTPLMTLAQYCCISTESKLILRFESSAHILDLASKCVSDGNYSNSQKFGMVMNLMNQYSNQTIFNPENCHSYFENESCHKAKTEAQHIVYLIFWILVLLTGFFGNSAVVLAVNRSSNLRALFTNYFIASLAVSDLLISLIIVPLNMKFALDNLFFCSSHMLCRFRLTLDMILFVASITNLFVIAADRFCALVKPYTYF